MTAVELGREIGAGAIDAVDLTDFFLDRIATEDPDHLVYLRLTPERARAEAIGARARANTGLRLGPLDGVPLSWKDLVDMAGVETNAAARALQGRVPEHDAPLLARAARAGTVCLGKTNMTEFAFSGLGINHDLWHPCQCLRRPGQAYPRRFVIGCGRFGRAWIGAGRHRLGYRRVGSHPGIAEPAGRAQDDGGKPAA